MKVIGTRIRVETSEHKTEYFPEYCLEWKTLFGKVKRQWYGVCDMSSHHFGGAFMVVSIKCQAEDIPKYSMEWAKRVIDYQANHYKQQLENEEHHSTKEIAYVKYP